MINVRRRPETRSGHSTPTPFPGRHRTTTITMEMSPNQEHRGVPWCMAAASAASSPGGLDGSQGAWLPAKTQKSYKRYVELMVDVATD
ncbi:unnamed protein product [Boreogadus saida]